MNCPRCGAPLRQYAHTHVDRYSGDELETRPCTRCSFTQRVMRPSGHDECARTITLQGSAEHVTVTSDINCEALDCGDGAVLVKDCDDASKNGVYVRAEPERCGHVNGTRTCDREPNHDGMHRAITKDGTMWSKVRFKFSEGGPNTCLCEYVHSRGQLSHRVLDENCPIHGRAPLSPEDFEVVREAMTSEQAEPERCCGTCAHWRFPGLPPDQDFECAGGYTNTSIEGLCTSWRAGAIAFEATKPKRRLETDDELRERIWRECYGNDPTLQPIPAHYSLSLFGGPDLDQYAREWDTEREWVTE